MSRLLRILLLAAALIAASELRVEAEPPRPPDRVTSAVPLGAAEVEPLMRASAIHFASLRRADGLAPRPALPARATLRQAGALHRGPAASFATGTILPVGVTVRVRSVLGDGRWVEVSYRGQRGWLPATVLALDAP